MSGSFDPRDERILEGDMTDPNHLEPTDITTEPQPVTAETLVEEVSIDGMCGVY